MDPLISHKWQTATPFSWPIPFIHPQPQIFHTGHSTASHWNCKGGLYPSSGYCWLCCHTLHAGTTWLKSTGHLNCLSLAEEARLVIWMEEKWHVYWQPWHDKILQRVSCMLGGIQEMYGYLQQWWRPWFHSYQISCVSRISFSVDPGYVWWVNILCKWLTQNSMESCKRQGNATVQRWRAFTVDFWYVNIWVG